MDIDINVYRQLSSLSKDLTEYEISELKKLDLKFSENDVLCFIEKHIGDRYLKMARLIANIYKITGVFIDTDVVDHLPYVFDIIGLSSSMMNRFVLTKDIIYIPRKTSNSIITRGLYYIIPVNAVLDMSDFSEIQNMCILKDFVAFMCRRDFILSESINATIDDQTETIFSKYYLKYMPFTIDNIIYMLCASPGYILNKKFIEYVNNGIININIDVDFDEDSLGLLLQLEDI